MKQLILAIILIALSTITTAQTGPGGIGKADGTSTLEFWLKADNGVEEASNNEAEDGDNVSGWLDQSGNNNDVSQDYGSPPSFDITSGLSAVDFENGSKYLRGNSVISGTTARTFFTVAQPSSMSASVTNCSWALAPNNNGSMGTGYGLFWEEPGSSTGLGLRVNGRKLMDYTSVLSTNDIISNPTIYSGSSASSSDVLSTDFYINGSYLSTHNNPGSTTLNTNSVGVIIGGFSTGGDLIPENNYDFNGKVYELIVFSEELNSAQRIIMENYLSAKYNTTISSDKFAYDDRSSGSIFYHDVAGIGQASDASQHTSASSSIVNIRNAASNANDRFIIFGHDDLDKTSLSTSETPDGGAGDVQRINSEWRFDESGGDIGDLDVYVDLGSISIPSGFLPCIMLDSDGDFSSGATVHDLSHISGDEYSISDINIADGDYLTIAMVRRKLNFTNVNLQAFENNVDAYPEIEAELNIPFSTESGIDVQFNLSITGDGNITIGSNPAQAGDDITNDVLSATISAGNQTVDINDYNSAPAVLELIDDSDVENTESCNFTITSVNSPASGVSIGNDNVLTFDVLDDDEPRKISFSTTNSSTSEDDSPNTSDITITLELPTGETAASSAPYTSVEVTASGTANVGSDFKLLDAPDPNNDNSYTVQFASGANSANISLRIMGDDIDEDNETVVLNLSNPVSSALASSNIEYTATITDDDNAPTVTFSSSSSSATESTNSATISISLSEESGKEISLPFSFDAASSTAENSGIDFSINTSSPLIFSAGETTKSISLSIVNDADEELDETIEIDLASPVNAGLGAITTHIYTIENDDVFGSTGPAGVGSDDGSSSLELWLSAYSGVENSSGDDATDGDGVDYWRDKSGNNKDMQNDYGSQPVFRNSGIPYLDFSASSTYLRGNSVISGNTARTFATVIQPSSVSGGTSNNCAWQLSPNSTDGTGYGLFVESPASNSGLGLRVSGNKLMDYTSAISSANLIANPTIYLGHSAYNEDVTDTRFFLNAEELLNVSLQTSANLNTSSTGVTIGGFSNSGNNTPNSTFDYNGNIYEIIVFSEELNETRKLLINNYLAAQYGLSLNEDDIYNEDNSASGDYDFDVAGIGRINNNDYHLSAKGSGYVKVYNPDDLDDNEFLIWGHDNGPVTADETTDVPPMMAARMDRIWRASEVNSSSSAVDVGNIDIDWDLSMFIGILAVDVHLLIDTDNDGNFNDENPIGGANHLGSGIYQFQDVSQLSNNNRFTIAFESQPDGSTLPVELISFDAKIVDDKVELNWQTASEFNNKEFVIERSKNATDWSKVLSIPSKGNSNNIVSYKAFDRNPLNGKSFYRLKQIDVDGSTEVFKAVSVFKEFTRINISPNPFIDLLNIEINSVGAGNFNIEVINSHSELLKSDLIILNSNFKNISYNLKGLKSGIYFLRIYNNSGFSDTFKIVKI